MNFLDLASYLPKLGRMTAGLTDSYSGSYFGSDSLASGPNKVRKKNRKVRKGEAIMLVKKQLFPSQSSACKNPSWTNQQAPAPLKKKPKASMVIPKSKNVSIKKKIKVSKTAKPPNTEQLLKQAKQIAGDTKNLHLLQEAIVEFKTQRDQLVHSLNGLQKKLKEFQIPELFAPSAPKSDKVEKDRRSSNEKQKKHLDEVKNEGVDKADDQGDRNPDKKKDKAKKRKDVRSVSQHFYLADMTESEDSSTTTSSSSSESSSSEDKDEVEEKKLAAKKVKDFLDSNLIPIKPPEKGHNLDRVNSLMKHNSPWASKKSKSNVDGKLSMLKRSVMDISNKKIPGKTEASKQKSSFEVKEWGTQLLTQAAVQVKFKKLQRAKIECERDFGIHENII